MSRPGSKRQKVEHVPSSDADEEASFASFSDEDEDGGEEELEVEPDDELDVEDLESAEADEGADEDEDEEEEEEEAAVKPVKARSSQASHSTGHQPAGRSAANAQSASSAYAGGNFKSNVFKLQVDELLEQIRPRSGKREAAAEAALRALKNSIEHIPPGGPSSLADAERMLIMTRVAAPFPEPRPARDSKLKFAYAKPSKINVVGSFALKTTARSQAHLEVDMVVVMPGSIFEEKDFLNHRYFYKRAFYLACIASALKEAHQGEYDIRFKLLHDDPLKPVLVVSPIGATSNATESAQVPQWTINIVPCIAQDQFPVEKLRPDRNCVRSTEASKDSTEQTKLLPTPAYNSSLRSDMLMTPYLHFIYAAKRSCEAFADACLLGSTWLRQRGFGSSIPAGGFGNFEWSALMAMCLTGGAPNGKPLLSEGYSSYQLFKATIQVLAMKSLVKSPLIIGESPNPPSATGNGLPMVWDAARNYSLLFKMSAWSYSLLRLEARTTLHTLGDQLYDGFEATFIFRVQEPLLRFDSAIRLPVDVLTTKRQDLPTCLDKLYNLLKHGLGKRVREISIGRTPGQAWNLGTLQPMHTQKDEVTICFVVNPDAAKSTVDQGPSAEDKVAVAAFRKFWGDKAELRRFKDGSILETVVWTAGIPVFEQIVRHLLNRHLGIAAVEAVHSYGNEIEKLVPGGTDLSPFNALSARYKQLEDEIRNLQDLPLRVRQMMPADAQLRYASTRLPASGRVGCLPTPADVTIQFEGDSRWPDDLVAVQRTKIAFLLKLSELLRGSSADATARIGLENEGQEMVNQAFLDVTYDSDATFRLRIHHEREQGMLERQLRDKVSSPKTREIAAIGLAKYKRDCVKVPMHTQAISRLCVRYPMLSGIIRLTKRWFASHLLTNHIADEVIELLVARTFMQPWPWQTPSSVQTGFLRTLSWISRWDWRAEPLIVDLSGSNELKPADVQAITVSFEAWRKLDPSLNRVALFAASNVDHEGTTWTDGLPAKVVAGRMTALAKAACAEIVEKQLRLEPASLFSSPLGDFDFVLHLSPKATGSKVGKGANRTAFKNLALDAVTDTELIGYEPVQAFLQELETLYASAVVFFSGGLERPVIAGLWSPQTARRAWKVNLAYSTIPSQVAGEEDEGEVYASLNKTAVLAELARLGGDLVERMEVFKK